MIKNIHHIAIICSDYAVLKAFYVEKLGFTVMKEIYRKERESYKLDLALKGSYCIELFSFPDPPPRINGPEAVGLRHLAFEVENIEKAISHLESKQIMCENIRVDAITGQRFTFFQDPDGLPLELYES